MFKITSTVLRNLSPISTRSMCFGPPVGLTGMGRIGKMVLRKSFDANSTVNVVAINQPDATPENVAHSLKYDTVHGMFDKHVEVVDKCIKVNGRKVRILCNNKPENIPWADMGVEYVIESSGRYTKMKNAMKHLISPMGARKVIVTGPSEDIPMFVKGVNFDTYKHSMNVVSSASCTTNCALPLIKVIHDKFEVDSCMFITTHAMTSTQNVYDGCNWRSGLDNIVPSSTGAAVAIGMILPDLKCKVIGDATRIPVLNSSLLKLYMNILKNNVTVDTIKNEIIKQVECPMKDVLNFVDKKNVSSDFIGCQYSAVVDFNQILVVDKLIMIGAWYDNEMAYACRVLDLVKHMESLEPIQN